MPIIVGLNSNVFGSVQTRDESPIIRLQQNPQQNRESPARVVVSAAFVVSHGSNCIIVLRLHSFFKERNNCAAVQYGCSGKLPLIKADDGQCKNVINGRVE